MLTKADGIQVKCTQALRVQEHPVQTNKNLIIVDNLEMGKLSLYDYSEGTLNIQSLLWGNNSRNDELAEEIIIEKEWQDEGFFIHSVFWRDRQEDLIKPMIEQVMHFFDFYECYKLIGVSDRVYENCLPYARELLADFTKTNRTYVRRKK